MSNPDRSATDCPRPHHLLLAGERCPTCRATPASAPPEPRRTTRVQWEALYRWVISDPRRLPDEVCEEIEQLRALAARSSAEEGTTTPEPLSKLADRVEEWVVRSCTGNVATCRLPHTFFDEVVAGLRAASPPEGAAGEPLTIILAKRQAHADCLVITQVCDRDEAERRAERYYPLPSEPRVA